MMYNPSYTQLPAVTTSTAGQKVYTTFTDLATQKVLALLVEPSERAYSYTSEYSKLPVIGTSQPLLTYKSSEMTLSLPDVKFWTYGNQKDLTPVLKQLASFTQPVLDTGEPPNLKLTLGAEVFDSVRVQKFTYRVKMHMGGLPVMAEGSLDILLNPKPKTLAVVVPDTPPKLSQPEQNSSADKVKALLESDPIKAKLYSYTKGKSTVKVDETGQVLVDSKKVGYLKDILGSATPAGLNSASLTTDGKKKEALKYPTAGTSTKKS